MCLLVLAWQVHPRFPLIVAANRDEQHARPTRALARWSSPAGLLAGRDLRAGGTWLGACAGLPPDSPRSGPAFGGITNFHASAAEPPVGPDAPSRGALIPGFVASHQSPEEFMRALEPDAVRFAGFSLLIARGDELWYASNRSRPFARPLGPGIYGLSNHALDTPWPKLERVRSAFAAYLSAHPELPDADDLLDLLGAREPLPADAPMEDVLAEPFVVHPEFGTRSSTVVRTDLRGTVVLTERRFDPAGRAIGQTTLSAEARSSLS